MDKKSRNEYMRKYYLRNRARLLPILLERGKAYKAANREKVMAENRDYARRHQDQRRAWLVANRERVRASQRKSERKSVAALTDGYLRKNISKNTIPTAFVTPEMVELKRAIIKLKRLLWQNQKTSTNSETSS